jgi:hypothetical protein
VTNREKALEEALRKIAETADEEAVMAPDGWDSGNSPESVQTFATLALQAALSLPATSTETPEGWLTRERLEAIGSQLADYKASNDWTTAELVSAVRMALHALQQGGGR